MTGKFPRLISKLLILLSLLVFSILLANNEIESKFPEGIYALCDDGLNHISFEGEKTLLLSSKRGYGLSFWNNRLYLPGVSEYSYENDKVILTGKQDLPDKGLVEVVSLGRIAILSNNNDFVSFYELDGSLINKMDMLHEPDNSNQNVGGIFLDKNTFILCEDGRNNILKYDLKEGIVSVLKNISSINDRNITWLGAITHDKATGFFYLSTSGNEILKFTETSEPELVAEGLPGYVSGLWISGDLIYFIARHENGFFSYEMSTKTLNKLTDLENPKTMTVVVYPD